MAKTILASKNLAKTNAVKRVIADLNWGDNLETVEVNSGVSKTPESDNEGIQGCLNRIAAAREILPDADYYIGMEGIITRNDFGTFICGWAVVFAVKNDVYAKGCSAKVEIPEFIASKISNFGELSELVKSSYPSGLVVKMESIGTNGVITNEVYSRDQEFVDALKCAIGYLKNEKNFQV